MQIRINIVKDENGDAVRSDDGRPFYYITDTTEGRHLTEEQTIEAIVEALRFCPWRVTLEVLRRLGTSLAGREFRSEKFVGPEFQQSE